LPTAKIVLSLPRIEGPKNETRIVVILDNRSHWKCQEFHFEKNASLKHASKRKESKLASKTIWCSHSKSMRCNFQNVYLIRFWKNY